MQPSHSNDRLVYVAPVLGAVVLALLILGGCIWFNSYNMPARSMMPTLLVGDVFLARAGYYADHAPVRGEIAMFHRPGRNEDYVKRVIGLPGDTIALKAGRLIINGQLVERVAATNDSTDSEAAAKQAYVESLPDAGTYTILEAGDNGYLDEFGPYLVPAGGYFVMGDNRDDSNDSRVPDFGVIPRENFTDRPWMILYSARADRILNRLN